MPKPFKVINSLILIAIVIIVGMLGFSLIEGWPPLDALYMTIITISTIGYGETHDLSDAGRIFNIVLIVMSISVVAYGISNIVGYVVEGKLNSYFKVRRMEKLLSGLRDHYVICGAGRTGHAILEEYCKAGVPFVVIDKNPEIIEALGSKDIPSIRGDSAQDAILKKAGIELAKGVIAVHATDSENLFTVLSCRQLRPDIYIVARVMDAVNEEKLIKCGANITISTSEIGGHRMASIALNPSINSFLDVVQKQSNDFSASVVEVSIESRSNLVGYSQRSADIRKRVGVTVLGILRDGENIFNPGPDECFREDDKVLIFGTGEQISRFKETFLREEDSGRIKKLKDLLKKYGDAGDQSKIAHDTVEPVKRAKAGGSFWKNLFKRKAKAIPVGNPEPDSIDISEEAATVTGAVEPEYDETLFIEKSADIEKPAEAPGTGKPIEISAKPASKKSPSQHADKQTQKPGVDKRPASESAKKKATASAAKKPNPKPSDKGAKARPMPEAHSKTKE